MNIAATYSIKDLENLTGIKAATIRVWETRYKILNPQRTDTNIRYYSNRDLKLLLNINILNKSGVKISRIAKLSEQEIKQKVLDISLFASKKDDLSEGFLMSMIDLDERLFNKVFSASLLKYGFEDTISQVIFPFFERIGVMWQTDAINPAQEHFISNLLRQKLLSAIDGLTVELKPDNKKVLILLPEFELHELGMLFCNYVLKASGFNTIYLGQAVPLDSLAKIINITQPDYIVSSLHNLNMLEKFEEYLTHLSQLFKGRRILVTGYAFKEYSKQLPSSIVVFNDLKVFKSFFN